ncbi:putative N terminus of Rad21 Rec8 like protein [Trypanosoma vivax]|nr:putative N terminus of Rad21 Rec8 like protein [Trypanosoma vivax]
MFFSTYVLTKKGPLAKIWLAAHWERRLTRNEVRVVDLRQSVVDIVQPVVPIALRTSGELLVGVVRIYALKVKHLLKDASDATLLLRVTTLPTKSAPESATTGKKDSNVSVDGVLDRSARALLDGVLLSGKGDIEAVTFDWAGGNGASGIVVTGSSGKADAEALEARFDDIADLLHGSKDEAGDGGLGSMSSGDMNAFLTSAWYSMEPSSYATEEVHNTQQDYDEIAKLRADLLAFGDHGEGSSNSRKSSLSSIEKARSSGVAGAAVMDAVPMGDFLAFPQPNDAIDIGAPLHGEQMLLPDFMIPSSGEAMDPFLLPSDALGAQTQQEDEDKLRIRQRKSRLIANAVDHGETTLSGDVIRRWMENHGDIVDAVPRHGPCDAQEVRDRSTLTQDSGNGEHWAAMDGSLLSGVPNPSLAALYRTTLTPLIEVAEAAMRRFLPQSPKRRNIMVCRWRNRRNDGRNA